MKNIIKKISSQKRTFLLTVVVLVVIFSFYGRANSYESAVVEKSDIREFLSAPGKIVAEKEANLAFKATGKVVDLPFSEGESVKKGDVVAKLDNGELLLALGRTRDDLRKAEATLAKVYDEVKDNDEDESFSQRESRTQAEVARDKAIKSVISAQRSVADFSLYAPFDSSVIDTKIELNEWVSAFSLNEYHIKLADLTNIYFEAEVDQESIANVQDGQEVIVQLDAFEDKEFSGEVFLISKTVEKTPEGDSIVTVKISFSNPPGDIILGLEGDAQIILFDKKDVLTIPKNAPMLEGGKRFVKVSGQKKEVDLGVFDGVRWEVLSGLSEGEKVSW